MGMTSHQVMGWHGVAIAIPGREDTRLLPPPTNSTIENMRVSATD